MIFSRKFKLSFLLFFNIENIFTVNIVIIPDSRSSLLVEFHLVFNKFQTKMLKFSMCAGIKILNSTLNSES